MQKFAPTINPVESLPKDEWDKFIYSIIRPFLGICNTDASLGEKDLEQEAWKALLVAAKNFDPNRETKFTTFAYTYIRGGVLRYILNSSKHLVVKHLTSKRPKNKEDWRGETNYVDVFEAKPEIDLFESNDFIDKIMEIVQDHPDKHLFIEHYFNDKSYRELAAQTGFSHAGVGLKIKRVLKTVTEQLR